METRAGQPLRPLTLPNLVGFARLVMIAAFLALAFSSGDGRDALATVCFCIAAGGDYLDGLVARLTGQFSRLGALMDPLLDRLVVLAGAALAWTFELLPRWALAVLAAREAAMVAITLAGLRLGLDISINWIGRIAVWPTMAGLGIALIADSWVADALFLAGVAGSIVATFLYVSDGIRRLRMRRTTLDSQNGLQDFGAR